MLTRRHFLQLSTSVTALSLIPSSVYGASAVRCPILMYHYVSEPPADANATLIDLAVLPETFATHLDYLQENNFTTITLKQLYNALMGTATLPEKPVVLTFDDGHWDAYANVAPVLLGRSMKGTFFLVGNFMEQYGHLTWWQAQALQQGGLELGGHSMNHVDLSQLDREGQIAEIAGCADVMEQNLGVRPEFFAYPFGLFNRTSRLIAKEAGYLGAVTTQDSLTHTLERRYRMGRVRIRATTNVDSLAWLLNR
jgi:peptidoglycan/xylan/chitin deacetylase (PgdA/CDA1 family)